MNEEETFEKEYQKLLQHSTDYVATFAMMQTKYSFDPGEPSKLFEILEKNAEDRRQYFDDFVERVSKLSKNQDKEAFKSDLLKYLHK